MSQLTPDQRPEGWNRTSEGYDEHVWTLVYPFAEELVERAAIDPADEVLDVAAGTGAVTMLAARRARRVMALDFAESMLERLRARVRSEEAHNVGVTRADGQNMPLEDGSFDVVCCNFGVIFFPDRGAGLSEMRRVLRPGGRALLSAWSTPDRFEMFQLFTGTLKRALPDLPLPERPPVFSLSDREQLERELREAGFDEVRVETVRHTYDLESPERFFEGMRQAAPPVAALMEQVGPEGRERFQEALPEVLRERFGEGPLVATNEAHVAAGYVQG